MFIFAVISYHFSGTAGTLCFGLRLMPGWMYKSLRLKKSPSIVLSLNLEGIHQAVPKVNKFYYEGVEA